MKTIKIDKNSWHYHIVYKYTDGNPKWIGSICEYNKQLLFGMLSILMIIIISSFLWSVLLAPIFYGILYLIYGLPIEFGSDISSIIGIGVTFYVLGIGSYIAHLLIERKENKLYEMRAKGIERKDSYIVAAWKSFKDKVCVKIEISN